MPLVKFYIIRSSNREHSECYVGSTVKQYLASRMSEHRDTYRKNMNGDISRGTLSSSIIFEKYGLENCIIELIEERQCETKDERNKIERYYIETIPNTVNKTRYLGKTNDERLKYWKDYNAKRRETTIECICGKTILEGSLPYHITSKGHMEYLSNNIEEV